MRTNSAAPVARREVNGTRTVASALGVCVGVSGLDHGFFEALQGNTATPGLIVQAIGPAQRMWIHGTEEAFTIVPNFLVTGILAMVVGVLTIAWSIGFIDRPNGSRVLLLLGGLLFLVGGGIGMLVFLLFGWAVARRIHRPLTWWRSVLPAGVWQDPRAGVAGTCRRRPGAVRLRPRGRDRRRRSRGVRSGAGARHLLVRAPGDARCPGPSRSSARPSRDVAGASAQHPAGASVAHSR